MFNWITTEKVQYDEGQIYAINNLTIENGTVYLEKPNISVKCDIKVKKTSLDENWGKYLKKPMLPY